MITLPLEPEIPGVPSRPVSPVGPYVRKKLYINVFIYKVKHTRGPGAPGIPS
jgi:hypothetical protein